MLKHARIPVVALDSLKTPGITHVLNCIASVLFDILFACFVFVILVIQKYTENDVYSSGEMQI